MTIKIMNRPISFYFFQTLPDFLKPVEFCSDMFLLPLGLPPIDTLDLHTNSYLRNPGPLPPTPPPRPLPPPLLQKPEQTYYEILLNKLEFNNNAYVSDVLSKNTSSSSSMMSTSEFVPNNLKPVLVLEPIYESHENEQYL